VSKVFLKFIRSDGCELNVNDDVWGITDIKGLDKPEITVYTQKAAIGDGDLVTGSRVGARTIEIELTARNVVLNEVLRRAATSFFTAGRTYALYVTRYGEPRYARECWLDSLEIPTERQFKRLVARIDLLCPEGYFLSADSFSKNIAEIEGRCGYPYVAAAAYGRIYGIYTYAGLVYLDNDGDTEAYCQAVFIARGDVTNPKLLAGDGYVRVIGTMSAGDVLMIDGREKSVTMNDVNISNQLDKDSDFGGIVFSIGTNSVGFTADIGSNVLDVYVYYNKRYMGA
jgi:hypothetical protein